MNDYPESCFPDSKLYPLNGTLYRKSHSGYAFYLDGKKSWRISASVTNDDLEKGNAKYYVSKPIK